MINYDNKTPKGGDTIKAFIALSRGKQVENTSRSSRDLESLFVEEVKQEVLEAHMERILPK